MTDTSLTRSTASNLILLANLPAGELLATALALEDRSLPTSDAVARAASIQVELAVVSLFRGYVARCDTRAAHICRERHHELLGISLERLIGPPGSTLETLRAVFLVNPALDLGPELDTAAQMQANNCLPAEVPPLGSILTKPRTNIGGDEVPVTDPLTMKAVLIAQACMRAMLPPYARKPSLMMRTRPADPLPLRLAQQLANHLLQTPDEPTPRERVELEGHAVLAEALLEAADLSALAGTLREFRGLLPPPSDPTESSPALLHVGLGALATSREQLHAGADR